MKSEAERGEEENEIHVVVFQRYLSQAVINK